MKDPVRSGNFVRPYVMHMVQRGANARDYDASIYDAETPLSSVYRSSWLPKRQHEESGFRIVRNR